MKTILTSILNILARLMLYRFRPRVVAITGSVGKTSTKEAIAVVLGGRFQVRKSLGNYNNEIGVPLAIIGEQSPGKNVFGWMVLIIKTLIKLFSKNYPKILILEMGADRPGDITYLVDLVEQIEVGVVTDIGISHLEYFQTEEQIAREKTALIKNLIKAGLAVLNFDN